MHILSCAGGGRASGASSHGEMSDSWRDQASCLDVDPEFFFPEGKSPAAVEQAEAARAICWACPVLGQCRKLELTPTPSGRLRNEFGVFAAMTADERHDELRRRVRRARAGRRGVAA
jgi:WhiB family redox-sensing transcriptional regulator